MDNRGVPNMLRVLVVEDDPLLQRTLCATLTLLGFTPYHAATVDEALQILDTQPIDAITLDIVLPDPLGRKRAGMSLLALVRSRTGYETTPILIFTGMPLSDEESELAKRCNAEVFLKPQPYSLLASHIHRALGIVPAA